MPTYSSKKVVKEVGNSLLLVSCRLVDSYRVLLAISRSAHLTLATRGYEGIAAEPNFTIRYDLCQFLKLKGKPEYTSLDATYW